MLHPTRSHLWPLMTGLAIAGILVFWLGYALLQNAGQHTVESHADQQPFLPGGPDLHPVLIHSPDGPPALHLGIHPQTGRPLTASCTTCHNTRTPNPGNANTQDLDLFHQGLTVAHGPSTMSCLSCHNPSDYETLRSANGTAIDYSQSMTLCAQCHSPQYEDYTHGAHGGMTGYWDLSRGPRTRNTCVQCHDPHAPAFPAMRPTFKPIDRGLTPHTPDQKDGHD